MTATRSSAMFDQHVGINLLWLRPGEVGGSETYVRRVLRALSTEAPDLQLHLFGTAAALEAVRPNGANVEEYVAAARQLPPARRLFVEKTWLRSVARAPLDVLHHPGGTVPFVNETPAIVTIHDLQPLDDPSNFSRVKANFLARAIPAAIDRASIVATPSDWVRGQVIDRFGLSEEKVVTVSAYAEPRDLAAATSPSATLDTIFAHGPVVFYPAMTLRHKNHVMLFEAFAHAVQHDPDLQLVCVGAIGRDNDEIVAAAAASSARIHMLGHVSRSDLDALFVLSEAMVFPSLYEGFGLPVLEAQHAGLPVIASDRTAVPEVAGGSAIQLDPTNSESWTDAMVNRLSGIERARHVNDGLRNALRYSPERTARQQRSAYDRLTP